MAETKSIEAVYGMILNGDWNRVLDFVHGPPDTVREDPRFEHLVTTFVADFFRRLPPSVTEPEPGQAFFSDSRQAEAAERLVLFHTTDRIRLTPEQFRDVIVRLVERLSNQPARALDFARFLPEDPVCSALLSRFEAPSRRSTPSVKETGIHVTEQEMSASEAASPLFKSIQEERFFDAIRTEYSDLLAVPNIPLQTIVSADRIRSALTRRERTFLSRAVMDCVLFDPTNHYCAVVCFELDSPLHDDDVQIERDDMKNRILALAGIRLVRIRPDRTGVGSEAFREVLSSIRPISS